MYNVHDVLSLVIVSVNVNKCVPKNVNKIKCVALSLLDVFFQALNALKHPCWE